MNASQKVFRLELRTQPRDLMLEGRNLLEGKPLLVRLRIGDLRLEARGVRGVRGEVTSDRGVRGKVIGSRGGVEVTHSYSIES